MHTIVRDAFLKIVFIESANSLIGWSTITRVNLMGDLRRNATRRTWVKESTEARLLDVMFTSGPIGIVFFWSHNRLTKPGLSMSWWNDRVDELDERGQKRKLRSSEVVGSIAIQNLSVPFNLITKNRKMDWVIVKLRSWSCQEKGINFKMIFRSAYLINVVINKIPSKSIFLVSQ